MRVDPRAGPVFLEAATSAYDQPRDAPLQPKQAINAAVIQSLWGAKAQADGSGHLGVSAALWRLGSRPTLEIARPSCELTHVVSIWTKGQTSSELFLDGRRRFSRVRKRGTFQMARAGESVRALLSNARGYCLDIYLPVSLMRQCLEADFDIAGASLELLPVGLETDSVVANIGDAISTELLDPDNASRLAIDSASLSLAVRLIRGYSNLEVRNRKAAGGLAGWQKRRVLGRLAEQVGTNFSLSELASEVALSPFHFSRAFKKSVGVSPNAYQIGLRLERARSLLEDGNSPIGEIAQEVGYADAGYFSRSFRRRYGVSPGFYRRMRST